MVAVGSDTCRHRMAPSRGAALAGARSHSPLARLSGASAARADVSPHPVCRPEFLTSATGFKGYFPHAAGHRTPAKRGIRSSHRRLSYDAQTRADPSHHTRALIITI